MSLRFIPPTAHAQNTQANYGAPSAPGVHDTLRSNLSMTTAAPKASSLSSTATSQPIQSNHPLESRLAQWRNQQDSLKMSLLRRQFGIAEPVKRQMELNIVRAGEWRPAALGGSGTASVHADILAGRDTELDWEDVFEGGELRETKDFHVEMEGKFGMNW